MPLQLDRILATPVGGDTVGAPAGASTTVDAVGNQGWSLRDLSPPVVTLRASAIAHNLALMQGWTGEHGVELYPHGKTTMAPQLWARQLEAGAGGITAATPAQLRAMHSVGVPSVLLANEVVDADAIAWIGREVSTDRACWVDSVEGVELLADGLAAANGATLRVLVEIGHRGGRTGARSLEAALAVADAVARRRELTLVGVAGYEGTIGHERTPDALAEVDGFLGVLAEASDRIAASGLVDGPPILSAGGSLFFDRVAALAGPDRRVVLRAGCTITHDHGLYERGSPFADRPGPRFRPAIEAWGSVLSRPEPEVVVIGLGKRDVPSDIELPIPLRVRDDDRSLAGMRVDRLMDQHAICRVPAAVSLRPGDVIAFGISHPCAAFDRRRVLFELDDDDRVVGAIATVF